MKCSKCGAQCNDNLAFCLECGNPLQLMADFNLIEKELANSIGEFMDEMEEEKEQDIDFDGDNMKTIDVPVDEINMGLKVVDINRNMPKSDIDIDDDVTNVVKPTMSKESNESISRLKDTLKKSTQTINKR